MTIAQAGDKLKWTIDPHIFLFRRICGKVVKKDPITGEEYPVPFATVYVEDTDCSLISYFPHGYPWAWHFPFNCHREVIAQTNTDKCGRFCVWVPRFDIDWILKWQKERICFPTIFHRPWVIDFIPTLPPEVAGPVWPPIPIPDPGPLKVLTSLPASTIEAIAGHSASKLAAGATRLQAAAAVGSPNPSIDAALQARAFEHELPPPLPPEFQRALSGNGIVAGQGASASDGVRSAIALKLGLDASAKELVDFDPRRFVGPSGDALISIFRNGRSSSMFLTSRSGWDRTSTATASRRPFTPRATSMFAGTPGRFPTLLWWPARSRRKRTPAARHRSSVATSRQYCSPALCPWILRPTMMARSAAHRRHRQGSATRFGPTGQLRIRLGRRPRRKNCAPSADAVLRNVATLRLRRG